MLFNSFEFVVFFITVFTLYWILNKNLKLQNILLLVASYIFYGWWDWRFLFLLFFNSLVNFFLGKYIFNAKNEKQKKKLLYAALFFNLGLLGFFKYFNFFIDSFISFSSAVGIKTSVSTLNIILPVGISFYTFQALSYIIDIYRGNIKPVTNPISFFTFKAFFPQLVAGPIERASNLLLQIDVPRKFNVAWFKAGVFQIAVGFFRKVVIADSLAIYVDRIYGSPDLYDSNTLIFATVLYAFQIYFDFAGYSDIAIGTAKTMGFRFEQNFNLPYFSKSLTEFWRKWHMSLSYWLRDYLYISLGGNRKGKIMTYRNLMITMLLGGLWHGSSWNFVIWGAIHGVFLAIEKWMMSLKLDLFKNHFVSKLGYLYTFSVVCFAWIFFRAQTFDNASLIISKIFNYRLSPIFIGDINVFINMMVMLIIGILVDLTLRIRNVDLEVAAADWSTIKLAIVTSIFLILLCLFFSSSNNFIYFQF